MTLVHRALFTWLITLIFLILLCLGLETTKAHWNWFIIFTPLWIYDSILLIYIIIKIIRHWRNFTRFKELLILYHGYVFAVLLKVAAQILICLKLEVKDLNISIYVVMIPIWILLSTTIVYVSVSTLAKK